MEGAKGLVISLVIVFLVVLVAMLFDASTHPWPRRAQFPVVPARISDAINSGHHCWLEADYSASGDVTRTEWLCK